MQQNSSNGVILEDLVDVYLSRSNASEPSSADTRAFAKQLCDSITTIDFGFKIQAFKSDCCDTLSVVEAAINRHIESLPKSAPIKSSDKSNLDVSSAWPKLTPAPEFAKDEANPFPVLLFSMSISMSTSSIRGRSDESLELALSSMSLQMLKLLGSALRQQNDQILSAR